MSNKIQIRDRAEMYFQSHALGIAMDLERFMKDKFPINEGEDYQATFERFIRYVSDKTGIPLKKMVKIWNAEHNISIKELCQIKGYYSKFDKYLA